MALSHERPVSAALFTDLYELTMTQAYMETGMDDEAVFSLFARRLPERRNYLLACGLDDVLEFLENLSFDEAALSYLDSTDIFSDRFLDFLRGLRFTGEVHAVPEGTPVFADEPLIEVVAPLPQAQLVESFVMNQIHLQTVLASKAARVVTAAGERPVVDFGLRRMHGIDAGLKAARAFHIAGLAATSNVAAGQRYGIPISGTMAHSYIQAHDSEYEAFRDFVTLYPETVLLVDTYDTLGGARNVVALARELEADFKVRAVRLDSGDLGELARGTRRILDEAGLESVEIFASGGLNEDTISELLESGAPIDGFGVGTHMGVAEDAPSLDAAYKLVAYAGKGRMKLSSGKPIVPGRKQVYRVEDNDVAVRDLITRCDEEATGRALLRPVMQGGKRLESAREDLDQIRRRARQEIARLPERVRGLKSAEPPYPVEISRRLTEARDELKADLQAQHATETSA